MMTDLLPLFNELLKKYDASPITSQPLILSRFDHFIDEAYKINTRINEVKVFLKDIRPSYLAKDIHTRRLNSIAKKRRSKFLTDRDKEEIDAKIKQIFRELDAGIRVLAEAEDVRRQTEISLIRRKYGHWGLGSLGTWAIGGIGELKSPEQEQEEFRVNTISAHRENVLYFLRHRLQKWANQQASMMEKRISREIERNRNLLGQVRLDQISDTGTNLNVSTSEQNHLDSLAPPEYADLKINHELSSEQIQIFEKDNQDMVQRYETTLNQVRVAEKSLVEISELQNQLVHNLSVQSAHIEQLIADSHLTSENVGGGNKQLKEASQRKSTAKYVFYASCGLSLSLVIWDLFT
ncbi:Syntaxin ufe1 [Erysiphe necator]|nr:Syntaxin ufe1 [Erysiphe necator]